MGERWNASGTELRFDVPSGGCGANGSLDSPNATARRSAEYGAL